MPRSDVSPTTPAPMRISLNRAIPAGLGAWPSLLEPEAWGVSGARLFLKLSVWSLIKFHRPKFSSERPRFTGSKRVATVPPSSPSPDPSPLPYRCSIRAQLRPEISTTPSLRRSDPVFHAFLTPRALTVPVQPRQALCPEIGVRAHVAGVAECRKSAPAEFRGSWGYV